MEPFGTRLGEAMRRRGRLCVGVDPHPSLLAAWGLADDPSGLETFAQTCAEALAGHIALLKPQAAFFERHGSAGLAVLERFVAAARESGALVLLDAKRGDIGSTMQGYADAYLDQASPMAVDAITVHPYLGFESLRPALDCAAEHGSGVFVVTLTSNPEGSQVQSARTGTGATVAAEILAAIAAENTGSVGLGSVGAVVGATVSDVEEDLAINGPLLAPGLGAQGGTVDDIRRTFHGVLDLVVPSTSRDVLRHGPDATALTGAALRTLDGVQSALRA
jgi:orotidine 5'-phosphate decarboxylase subfamily 2